MNRSAPNRLTIIALFLLGVVATICIFLGRWQLDRAEQRREIAAVIDAGRKASPLTLSPLSQASALEAWRPAIAQGYWRSEWSVLLDNRNLEGKPGLWLATPLMLDNQTAVLVVRGWVQRPIADRSAPKIRTPEDVQKISGELLLRVPRLFELWSSQASAELSLPQHWKGIEQPERSVVDTALLPRLQNVDLTEYAKRTGLVMLPAVLMQAPVKEEDGLTRVWPEPSLDADKNIGYAVQWFGFSGIVLIAFLVILWRHFRRRK